METPAERLYKQCRQIATGLCGYYHPHMIDDVTQEMAVTILEAEPGNTDGYYIQLATWRAQDYLEKFRNFPKTGLDENREL